MASNGSENEGSFAVEMENLNSSLVASVRQMLDALPPKSPDYCIYRASQRIRQVNEKGYTPQKVSIGPLHHGKEHLLPMEEQKLRYLTAFLERTRLSLEDCISFIRQQEQSVRHCYVESINLGSDEFVKIILVDSCFIIDVILRADSSMPRDEMDYLSNPVALFDDVQIDMILLENQIPLFAIAGLYDFAFPQRTETEPSFAELCVRYFAGVSPLLNIDNFNQEKFSRLGLEAKHFVDLMRLCHLPSIRRSHLQNNAKYAVIPTARELQEVGMTITKGSSKDLVDIKYANEVLSIPHFEINYTTETVLRNIIAYEMCHCMHDSYIIDYAIFMDILIDTVDDVDILVQNGVFTHVRDRASVANLFNSLTVQVSWYCDRCYYNDLFQEVNNYCKVPWHKWRAIMKRDYFSTPWRIVAIIAAGILLLLTLIQTVCSIIQTWK